MSAHQARERELPTGTVTFVFTDIEGSTRLLSRLGDEYPALLEAHAAVLRSAISDHDGVEVNTEGDAFFAAFARAEDAVDAAVAAQRGLATRTWPSGATVRVRVGIHSGEGQLGGDDYVGMDVHRAARIASAAHGGQVIISAATQALLPSDVDVIDLGAHELKDLDTPDRLYQVAIADLPGDFPPPRARRRGNIPEPATSFIGREDELAEIEQFVTASRLVTITGPGGVGKTRLALEAATRLARSQPDGAWFVPLDALREADLLPTAIAIALRLTPGEHDPMAYLKEHLADDELLLVLDNLEQIAGAGTVVDELMQAASGLRVLATSQSPLGLYGEHEFQAPPLGLPAATAPPAVDQMLEYEAVALFAARARAVKPRFALDEHDAAAVAELVTRLDGMPLAIELAAARIKLLTPKAILDRLEKRLDLLASSAPNVPARQRTLRGAIDWSYGLLEPAEQHVFDRLGVFAGGLDLDTAEAIVDPAGECGVDVLDALGSLVEKSLLRQQEHRDTPRFSQLESIRQYATDRLIERGEAESMHRRLAEHMAALVAAAEPHLDRVADPGWFERLDVEQDNLRAAMRWALTTADADLGERLVGPVWRFWVRKGLLAEGAWWTEEVLRLSDGPTPARAKALNAQGSLAYWRTDYDGAEGPYKAALEICRDLGDEAGMAEASYNLSYALLLKTAPDLAGATAAMEAALAGFRAAGDRARTQSTLFAIGYYALQAGDLDEAERVLREALEMDAGDVRPRTGLATVAYERGDYAEARRWLDELVAETAGMPDEAFAIAQLETYTTIELAAGNETLAMELYGAAQALRRRIGGGPPSDGTLIPDPEGKARVAIGDEAVDAAIGRGGAMDARSALEYAASGRGAAGP